jgi:hypothetical protein
MKKVFFAAEDILFRNSANFCSEMERQTLPFLAFLFLFPLHNFCRCEEQATYGVESTLFFFPGRQVLLNLLLGDPVASEASIDVPKRRI